MDNYEPDPHTEQCKERAQYLRDKIMPIFTDRVEAIWGAIENGQVSEVDEFMMNEFIEASRMVFDGVHDVRRAVLQIRVSTKEDTSGKACHPALKKSFSTCFFLNFFLFPFFSRKNLADPSQLKFGKICPITTTLKYRPQTMNAQKSSLKPFTSKLFASNSTGLLKVFWRTHFSLFLLSLLFLLFPIFVIFLSILSFHLSFSPTRICMISTHNRMFYCIYLELCR